MLPERVAQRRETTSDTVNRKSWRILPDLVIFSQIAKIGLIMLFIVHRTTRVNVSLANKLPKIFRMQLAHRIINYADDRFFYDTFVTIQPLLPIQKVGETSECEGTRTIGVIIAITK